MMPATTGENAADLLDELRELGIRVTSPAPSRIDLSPASLVTDEIKARALSVKADLIELVTTPHALPIAELLTFPAVHLDGLPVPFVIVCRHSDGSRVRFTFGREPRSGLGAVQWNAVLASLAFGDTGSVALSAAKMRMANAAKVRANAQRIGAMTVAEVLRRVDLTLLAVCMDGGAA